MGLYVSSASSDGAERRTARQSSNLLHRLAKRWSHLGVTILVTAPAQGLASEAPESPEHVSTVVREKSDAMGRPRVPAAGFPRSPGNVSTAPQGSGGGGLLVACKNTNRDLHIHPRLLPTVLCQQCPKRDMYDMILCNTRDCGSCELVLECQIAIQAPFNSMVNLYIFSVAWLFLLESFLLFFLFDCNCCS